MGLSASIAYFAFLFLGIVYVLSVFFADIFPLGLVFHSISGFIFGGIFSFVVGALAGTVLIPLRRRSYKEFFFVVLFLWIFFPLFIVGVALLNLLIKNLGLLEFWAFVLFTLFALASQGWVLLAADVRGEDLKKIFEEMHLFAIWMVIFAPIWAFVVFMGVGMVLSLIGLDSTSLFFELVGKTFLAGFGFFYFLLKIRARKKYKARVLQVRNS